MISTSGATAVYCSIKAPTAEDKQGARPPAVNKATLRIVMRINLSVYVFDLETASEGNAIYE
jgi:hypothetical protein